MNPSLKRIFYTLLPALVVASGIVGCAEIRKLTYPKDFVYIEDKEVRSLMQRMGSDVAQLERLLVDASASDSVRKQEIITELDDLERIALRLSGGHKQTNQFVIGDHIEEFISDISTAKTYASIDPPNYSKARGLTDSCQGCHQFR